MSVSLFAALEREVPSVDARAMMQAAQAALYPHAAPEHARQMWRRWSELADPPKPVARVAGAMFTLNGMAVTLGDLKAGLADGFEREPITIETVRRAA